MRYIIRNILITCLLVWFFQGEDIFAQSFNGSALIENLNLNGMVQPVPQTNKFIDPGHYVWCGSVTKGKNGKYYMLYSRWPLKDGFYSWPVTSEIAVAVADQPAGPFKHLKVALPARGTKFWDGSATHNPAVISHNGKYYLYYMGTSSSVEIQQPAKNSGNWWYYRNSQRIGVAVADSPDGEWKRLDHPVLTVSKDSTAPDALMVSNPATCFDDKGHVILLYKQVCKNGKINGGRVRFGVAFADSPFGPFVKHNQLIFEAHDGANEWMVAEDPFIWFQQGRYLAIVRDVVGKFTGDSGAFALMISKNGFDWTPAKYPKVIGSTFYWEGGVASVSKLERPCLYLENGIPKFLYGATRADKEEKMSYNVAVPLLPEAIKNPVLPGFYPDPSICRVGSDYYLVNSSFSYFPGVPIFHSKDLVHWKQIGHVLNRASQLNLVSQDISGGIYAPAISYNNGLFYMITTFVGGGGNFFVTTKDPAGPWSDPVMLPEINGIDPSFFFDTNGNTWIVNNGPPPENKPLYNGHRAIWLQQFDLKTQKLIGERKIIINGGTDISKKPVWIEGPHLYKKNGFYYLMAAEGGTAENHSEVIFRSKSIWGPYEVFAGNPILTQRDLPVERQKPITCTGHADLVQTPDGNWFAVFLGCQPYEGNFYNTGRQTFMLPVDWSGKWPIILPQGKAIPETIKAPTKTPWTGQTFSNYSSDWRDEFDEKELKLDWNFIRTPKDKWYELKNNNLVINARPVDISEKANPSFIGRRQQHAYAEMTTAVKLEKGRSMEAGLVAFQNEKNFYKFILQRETTGIHLQLASASDEVLKNKMEVANEEDFIYLKIKALGKEYKFEYSLDNKAWKQFGGALDGKYLSTAISGGFVGTYLGLYAHSQTAAKATFDWVTYKELKNVKQN